MNTLDKALQQITISIDNLEPANENLSKLLAFTSAAYQLLAEEQEQMQQALLSPAKVNALSILEAILDQKLYLASKDNTQQQFQHIKASILADLQAAVNSDEEAA
jgi:hypothetical protein